MLNVNNFSTLHIRWMADCFYHYALCNFNTVIFCIVTQWVSTVQHNLQWDQWLFDSVSLHRWPVSYVFSPRLHSNSQMTAAPVIPYRALSLRVTLLISCFVLNWFLLWSVHEPFTMCNVVACSNRGLKMQIWEYYISGFTCWNTLLSFNKLK